MMDRHSLYLTAGTLILLLRQIQGITGMCTTANLPADVNATPGTPTGTTVGATVTYTCKTGYQVVLGTPSWATYTITCFTLGWGPPIPTGCTAIECLSVAPTIPNTFPSTNANDQALNTEVTYRCRGGLYIAQTITNFSYKCQLKAGSTYEAEWALHIWPPVVTPVCSEPACPPTAYTTYTNAVAGTATGTSTGSTITYICKDGYQVVSGKTATKTFTRTCDRGNWGAPTPALCTADMCTTANLPADVNATPGTPTGTTVGATVTYTCKTGYHVVSGTTSAATYTSTCFTLGWGRPIPAACTAGMCTTANLPADVNATPGTPTGTTVGATVTYTCKTGYHVVLGTPSAATYTITCFTLGWGPPIPAACTALL